MVTIRNTPATYIPPSPSANLALLLKITWLAAVPTLPIADPAESATTYKPKSSLPRQYRTTKRSTCKIRFWTMPETPNGRLIRRSGRNRTKCHSVNRYCRLFARAIIKTTALQKRVRMIKDPGRCRARQIQYRHSQQKKWIIRKKIRLNFLKSPKP